MPVGRIRMAPLQKAGDMIPEAVRVIGIGEDRPPGHPHEPYFVSRSDIGTGATERCEVHSLHGQ